MTHRDGGVTSFPNIPLILGASLTITPSKQLCLHHKEKRNVRKLTLHIHKCFKYLEMKYGFTV
jgi:hypothetical protein